MRDHDDAVCLITMPGIRTLERNDRKYGPAGQLLEAHDARGVTTYDYDPEGNLIKKVEPDGAVWKYEWNGAGMLARVVRPNGHVVEFGYDPLARRTFKKYRSKITRWIWDGNVPLHEWVERDGDAVDEDFARAPREDDALAAGEKALKAMLAGRPANGPPKPTASVASLTRASAEGTIDSPVTWVFEPESFAPLAKIVDGQRFGIVVDHLGTPRGMFDEQGARCGARTSTHTLTCAMCVVSAMRAPSGGRGSMRITRQALITIGLHITTEHSSST
jgi:YD repeat-containing protein